MLRSRLVSLSVILVIGFLLLVSLVISTALAALSDYLDYLGSQRYYMSRT